MEQEHLTAQVHLTAIPAVQVILEAFQLQPEHHRIQVLRQEHQIQPELQIQVLRAIQVPMVQVIQVRIMTEQAPIMETVQVQDLMQEHMELAEASIMVRLRLMVVVHQTEVRQETHHRQQLQIHRVLEQPTQHHSQILTRNQMEQAQVQVKVMVMELPMVHQTEHQQVPEPRRHNQIHPARAVLQATERAHPTEHHRVHRTVTERLTERVIPLLIPMVFQTAFLQVTAIQIRLAIPYLILLELQ